MSVWFFINAAVLIFAIWKMSTGNMSLPILFGGLGLIFMLYNWTRHAVFSTIRSKRLSRKRRVKFAKASKKALPFHKWTGSLSLVFILIHFYFVIDRYGFLWQYPKMISGLVAFVILILMVSSGWLRFIRTTYPRRMIHLTLGFCLFMSVFVHLVF